MPDPVPISSKFLTFPNICNTGPMPNPPLSSAGAASGISTGFIIGRYSLSHHNYNAAIIQKDPARDKSRKQIQCVRQQGVISSGNIFCFTRRKHIPVFQRKRILFSPISKIMPRQVSKKSMAKQRSTQRYRIAGCCPIPAQLWTQLIDTCFSLAVVARGSVLDDNANAWRPLPRLSGGGITKKYMAKQRSTQRCRIAGCCPIPAQLWTQLD